MQGTCPVCVCVCGGGVGVVCLSVTAFCVDIAISHGKFRGQRMRLLSTSRARHTHVTCFIILLYNTCADLQS